MFKSTLMEMQPDENAPWLSTKKFKSGGLLYVSARRVVFPGLEVLKTF